MDHSREPWGGADAGDEGRFDDLAPQVRAAADRMAAEIDRLAASDG